MAKYTYTDPEVTGITEYVSTMFGAPVINVELSGANYAVAFNDAIEQYSNYITRWAIRSHLANAMGLDNAQDFTMRWVSQDFEFTKSFSKAYSEQLNVGGEIPIYKSYFTLKKDKQEYFLPNDIVVNEVMWQEPPAISMYLIDPNNNPMWVNYEFGWGYMGHSFMYVTPVSFSIQLAQHTNMRYKTLRGDFSYLIRPSGADATRTGEDYTGSTKNTVNIFPIPDAGYDGRRVWYFYKNESDLNKYAAENPGEKVTNPGTIRFDELPYSAFNSASQYWVKQYTLATCKEMLGRIRGKFSELNIPDATVTMDGDSLLSEAQAEKEFLKESLKEQLESMDILTMLEGEADQAEAINRTLSFAPMPPPLIG